MKRWYQILVALALILSSLAAATGSAQAQGGLARLRLAQTSPGVPAGNVLINGNLVFSNLAYKTITPYALVQQGRSTVQLAFADGTPAFGVEVNLTACTDYSLAFVGKPDRLEPLLLVDDNSPPAPGQARVRFLNASPNAPAIDVALAGGPVLFSNVPFKGVGSYVSLAAGTYGFELRQAGTGNVLLSAPNVTLDNCSVYTLYAVGLLSGEPSLEAITSLDAVTACVPPAPTVVGVPATQTPVPAVVPRVITPTSGPTSSALPTGMPSLTPSPSSTAPTGMATVAPSITATGTLSPTLTATAITPTASPSPTATGTLTPTLTATPTMTPSPTATETPVTPTATETAIPTETATAVPTSVPSAVPSPQLTAKIVTPAIEPPTQPPASAPTAASGAGQPPTAAPTTGMSQRGLLLPTPWWKSVPKVWR